MEELRAPPADRLALALINRRPLQAESFKPSSGGAMLLTEAGRRVVLVAYQQRKAEMVEHRVLREKIPFGMVPHIQARLLAHHLRGLGRVSAASCALTARRMNWRGWVRWSSW
jgi:CRISP-associated protein Cas1